MTEGYMSMINTQVEEAETIANQKWQERYGDKPEDGKPKEGEPAPEGKPTEEPEKGESKKDEPKEDFEHKYSVLKGKYDKEVPTMAFQIGEQSKKITEMEGKISELSKPKEEKKEEVKPPVESEKIRLLRTEYPDVADGVQEIVKSMIVDLRNEVDTKIKGVDQEVKKVNEDQGKTKKETFLSGLDGNKEIGSQWRTINQDPEFIDSLQEIEPYSGRTKHELLMDAFNGMDTERTAKFFKEFHKAKSTTKDEKPQKKIDDKEVHPPKGTRGSEVSNDDTPKPTTREELRNFYNDQTTGKWKGKEKEAEAEERRILIGLGIKVR